MSDMKKIGPVVRDLRKSLKMTLEDLANDADYDTGNLSKFERGLQGVEDETLGKLAAALRTTTADLLRKAADLEESEQNLKISTSDLAIPDNQGTINPSFAGVHKEARAPYAAQPHAVQGANKVPVFSEAHLIALADSPSAAHALPADKFAPPLPDSKLHDFAWEVTDDSMTASQGEFASYPQGSIAYLDPTLQAKSGDAVLVSFGTSFALTRVIHVNGHWVMSPLNQRYPTRELPLNAKVLAVAIGCMRIFRSR